MIILSRAVCCLQTQLCCVIVEKTCASGIGKSSKLQGEATYATETRASRGKVARPPVRDRRATANQ
eukprot:1403051-Amphidinium_carterae.1